MELMSARLYYHKFTAADFADYLGLATDKSVMRYITGKALTHAEAQTRFGNYLTTNQLHSEAGFFWVKTIGDDAFIGLAKLVYTTDWQAEVGYSLLPAFWGRQYASEVVSCLLAYAATIPHLTQLTAVVDPANVVSVRVLTKHHFTCVTSEQRNGTCTARYQLDQPFCRP